METGTKDKICEMRLLLSVKELDWFKENFPMFKWEAGDTKIVWNANKPEEVEMAMKAYQAYKKKHPDAVAYSVDKDNTKNATPLKDFDPNAEMILMQDWMQKG